MRLMMKWLDVLIMLLVIHEVAPLISNSIIEENGKSSYCNDDVRQNSRACESVTIKSRNDTKKLCNCIMVDGNLQIKDFYDIESESIDDISFPTLREIRGFLLIYKIPGNINLKNMFPNLLLVRGENLVSKYAIVVFNVALANEAFPSLRYVLRGLVYMQKEEFYPTDHKCVHLASKKSQSQYSFYFSTNISSVLDTRTPYGTDDYDMMCSSQCLEGCWSPYDHKACFICKNVLQGSTCKMRCSNGQYQLHNRCVTRQFCINKELLILDDVFKCLNERNCPSGYQRSQLQKQMCVPCNPNSECPKTCLGKRLETITDFSHVRGCEVITEALTINVGDDCLVLDLLQLSLSSVKVVEEFIHVENTNLKSLNFLKGINQIKGRKLYKDKYAIMVNENQYLESVMPHKKVRQDLQYLNIDKGDIMFESNYHLCPEIILNFINQCTGPNITAVNTNPKFRNTAKLSTLEEQYFKELESPINNMWTIARSNGLAGLCKSNQLNMTIHSPTGENNVKISYSLPSSINREVVSLLVFYKETSEGFNCAEDASTCPFNRWSNVEKVINESYLKDGKNDLVIPNLEYDKSYNISVMMFSMTDDNRDIRAFSKTKEGTTSTHNPSPPINVRCKSRKPSELDISWNPPIQINGEIDQYEVTIIPQKTSSKAANVDACSTQAKKNVKNFLKLQRDLSQDASTEDCEESNLSLKLARKTTDSDEICPYDVSSNGCQQNQKINSESSKVASSYRQNQEVINVFRSKVQNIFGSKRTFEIVLDEDSKYTKEENLCKITTNQTSLHLMGLKASSKYLVEVKACHRPKNCNEVEEFPTFNMSSDIGSYSNSSKCRLCSILKGVSRATIMGESEEIESPVIKNSSVNYENVIEIYWNVKSLSSTLAFLVQLRDEDTKMNLEDKCVVLNPFSKTQMIEIPDLLSGHYAVRILVVENEYVRQAVDWTSFYFHNSETNYSILLTKIISICLGVEILVAIGFYLVFKIIRMQKVLAWKAQMNKCKLFTSSAEFDEKLKIESSNLEILTKVKFGSGHFGNIFEAYLNKDGSRLKVALKVSRHNISLRNEALVMKDLDCHHVVRMIGVIMDGSTFMYAMEFMERKDLKNYLRNTKDDPLPLHKLLKLAAEACDGMAYLGALPQPLVHKDLAARNCLLDANLTLKIADFGLAGPPQQYINNDVIDHSHMPILWMAPESLHMNIFTTKTDVWSYGVLIWEISTNCKRPYENCSPKEVMTNVIKYGANLEIPTSTCFLFKSIIYKCFQYDPTDRPTFIDIYYDLKQHLPDLQRKNLEEVSFIDTYSTEKPSVDSVSVHSGEGSDSGFTRKSLPTAGSSQIYQNKQESSITTSKFNRGSTRRPYSNENNDSAVPLLQINPNSNTDLMRETVSSPTSQMTLALQPSIFYSCNSGVLSSNNVDSSSVLRTYSPLIRPRPSILHVDISNRKGSEVLLHKNFKYSSSGPSFLNNTHCICRTCFTARQSLHKYKDSPPTNRLQNMPKISDGSLPFQKDAIAVCCCNNLADNNLSINHVRRPFYRCQCLPENPPTKPILRCLPNSAIFNAADIKLKDHNIEPLKSIATIADQKDAILV